MVPGPCRQFAIAHDAQISAQGLLADRHAKFVEQPLHLMVRMLTWWVSLSRSSLVSRSEPSTEVQSSNGRFDMTIVEPRS
jgi:hypothetical protein